MSTLSHVDNEGRISMVDVSPKPETARSAIARGMVTMKPATLGLIRDNSGEKGDVLAAAQLAGIMAAKQTAALIPLCHPLPLTHVEVSLRVDDALSAVLIEARTRTTARTGVEMEALTAVAIAALTVYDMTKSVDRGMRIEAIRLVEKHGGQSGDMILE